MATFSLPALTLPDPTVSGEGALDPLGLANFADRLAEEMVPGVRARQNRVRFLTAIAVAAAVVDGLDDAVGADGSTTPQLAFEWLLVEGLVRAADVEAYRGTAGSFKARDAVERKIPMSAKTYLKTPTVFGFHGVYKTLAEELRIVDGDLRLLENGWGLVDVWEREQGVSGFLDRATALGGQTGWKQRLRGAVESALAKGHSDQSSSWAGWRFFAQHLGPSSMGRGEAAALHRLLTSADAGTRPEVFERIAEAPAGEMTDRDLGLQVLAPSATQPLADRLEAIEAYEAFCSQLEYAFNWICFSSRDPLRPAGAASYLPDTSAVSDLQPAIRRVERALERLSDQLQRDWHDIVAEFNAVHTADQLFHAILNRHHTVQSRKPPAGKRDWFERTASGDAIVRTPYRPSDPPERQREWVRPYRLMACLRFTRDLQKAGHGGA